MEESIVRAAVRRDLALIEQEIRSLKRALGAAWTGPMAAAQRRLCWLRAQATERCAARAWSRGRLHVRTPTRSTGPDVSAWHAAVAARLRTRYAEASAGAASPGSTAS
jgi:hypothetical protein